MSRRKEKARLAPFVPLLKETISCPAWKALSHGARSLYANLKTRYSTNLRNNGRIYLSTRDAVEELGSFSCRDNVRRWFRELQYYRFIVMTDAGCLGVDGKGKAPHWRLTEIGYMADPPTKDFLRWNGELFHEQKSPAHYISKKTAYFASRSSQSKKQNPGPPIQSTVDHPSSPPLDHPSSPPQSPSGPPIQSIQPPRGGPPIQAITRLTTPRLAEAELAEGASVDDGIPPFLDRRGNG